MHPFIVDSHQPAYLIMKVQKWCMSLVFRVLDFMESWSHSYLSASLWSNTVREEVTTWQLCLYCQDSLVALASLDFAFIFREFVVSCYLTFSPLLFFSDTLQRKILLSPTTTSKSNEQLSRLKMPCRKGEVGGDRKRAVARIVLQKYQHQVQNSDFSIADW